MPEFNWLDRLEFTRPYQWLRYSMNRGLVELFQKHVFAGRRDLRVAEVACGSGFAAHLIAQQPEVSLSIAADLNLEDHRQARIVDFQAAFVLMDIFHPGALAGSMDLVWNSSSVEELDSPEEAIRAMAWLAKPGGLVFVGVPNRRGLVGFLRRIGSAGARVWLGRVYNHTELGRLLESAELQVEHENTYLFGVFVGALARKPFKSA